mmetsp:Transcript_99616/g.160623  ORF Transcript_99616/g.160623 Transcript_99616/m.160623 type:complete len:974 (-) Transcript_99616:191-3112(-)
MGVSSPLTGGARKPDAQRSIWASAALVLALAIVSIVALSARLSSSTTLLDVAGMEKEAKLEHMLSEKLASKEIAHWNKINAAAFPSTAEVEAHATRRAAPGRTKMVERARMEQALKDKAVMQKALNKQAAKDHAHMQQVLKAVKPSKTADAKKLALPNIAVALPKPAPSDARKPHARTQKMLHSGMAPGSAPAEPVKAGDRTMDRLGDDVMDVPVTADGHSTDDGDVHVSSDDLGQYMFKQQKGQKLFLGEGPWAHVPVEGEMSGDGVGGNHDFANGVAVDEDPMTPESQMRVNPSTTPCRYLCSDPKGCDGHPGLTDGDCDETMSRDWDIEGHSWPDKYPASYDAWTGNNHGLFKTNKVQQLAGRLTLPPSLRQRQRLFLGEGPWAKVPVAHEMSGVGVGGDFDGANGIVVDSDPWSKEAQLRVNGAQPPCMYHCASPSGWCEGHAGLSEGDCEEVIGFEHDMHHTPQHNAAYPATYDSFSGNTNGLFKSAGAMPSLRAMAAAQFRAQEAADSEPAGLASLASPHPFAMMGARKAPGLGALAPTVHMSRLRQLQQRQMMLEGEEGEHAAAAAEGPAHPWRAAEVTADARHAPHCVGNGSGPCADTYIDMPHNWYGDKESDVALDVNDITPFMFKSTKGGYMLRQHRLAAQEKAPLTMLVDKANLGDEEFGADDKQVTVTALKGRGWGKMVDSSSGKLTRLATKAQAKVTALEKVDKFKELPVGEYRTHAEVSCIPGGPCADEVIDGLESNVVNVTKADCTSKEDCEGHTWESYFFKHKKGGAMLKRVEKKTFLPAHKLEEDSLDGMSDQIVSVNKGKVGGTQTPRWTKFDSPAAVVTSHKTPLSAQRKSVRSVLEKVKGDEVVDSVDNVHVDADKVGSGPHAGELQWNTFYSGKVVNGGAEAARGAGATENTAAAVRVGAKAPKAAMLAGARAYKDGGHVHYGLSDSAANADIDNFWKLLDNDPEHGGPKIV